MELLSAAQAGSGSLGKLLHKLPLWAGGIFQSLSSPVGNKEKLFPMTDNG